MKAGVPPAKGSSPLVPGIPNTRKPEITQTNVGLMYCAKPLPRVAEVRVNHNGWRHGVSAAQTDALDR